MNAPVPSNEAERLAALKEYHILDTGTEQSYDDITALAAHICKVPIAMISLVDEVRQWFKSRLGVEQQQTPREVAFCAHAILQNGPFIVTDAAKDRRLADSTLVTGEPHIRFYAGIPLINPAWNSNPANAYGPGLSSNPTPYLNPAAFFQPANGVFGNTPRYIDQLRNQWTQDEDLAVLKNFHLTESKYFEFRATATNFENRHIISKSPTTSFSSSNFGYITSAQASSPRSVQLGMKFIF